MEKTEVRLSFQRVNLLAIKAGKAELPKEFKRFLLAYHAHGRFLKNLRNVKFAKMVKHPTSMMATVITVAFWWGDTPEGYDYWETRSDAWVRYLKILENGIILK